VIIRRRRALLAGGLALVTGCGRDGDQERDAAAKRARTAADATAVLRRRTAADSADLLRRYDATATAHPVLAARLRPLRAEVARHVTAFGGNARAAAAAPPSLSASPSAAPSVPASASVPTSASAALAALADAEQRLVDTRTAALVDAVPELARLLASVAAAGAGHVLLLKETS
jgi:hypothetical protein